MKLKTIIHKSETLKDIEQELNKIMTETQGEAGKQQKFFNLLTRLNLPIDSADALSRRLSYPEMFKSVQEWIRNKRADRRAHKDGLGNISGSALSVHFSNVRFSDNFKELILKRYCIQKGNL